MRKKGMRHSMRNKYNKNKAEVVKNPNKKGKCGHFAMDGKRIRSAGRMTVKQRIESRNRRNLSRA